MHRQRPTAKKCCRNLNRFLPAAQNGDFRAVTNLFDEFPKAITAIRSSAGAKYAYDERLRGNQWQTVLETWGAFDAFVEGDEKYSADLAMTSFNPFRREAFTSVARIPDGSLITAMQKAHVNADPFFTLTQNALADGTYLQYLRSMYDGKIYTPTDEDSQKCFEDYVTDAKQRLAKSSTQAG